MVREDIDVRAKHKRAPKLAAFSEAAHTRNLNETQNIDHDHPLRTQLNVPFGVTYEKIGTIQRRLAWPLHKDDTLSRSGRPTGLNIYALFANDIFARALLRCSDQYLILIVAYASPCEEYVQSDLFYL